MALAGFRAVALIFSAFGTVALARPRSEMPIVTANDNRAPAGVIARDTLRIRLEVKMGRWYPEAADGPYLEAPVFGEEGKAPSIPGPLIRIPAGTTIIATVRNELSDSTVWIHGLFARPAKKDDSTSIAPGSMHVFSFDAGTAGTYFYFARAGTVNRDLHEREQLSGAFVVDPPGVRPDDRILMINIWGEEIDSTTYDNALAINGKSWPHTERFSANVGDTVHWKVINASIRPHPMHLHGFYYRVDSRGNYLTDSGVAAADRQHVVTRHMVAGSTMDITWSPNRPGNWLFHCHFTPHVDEGARLGFRSEHGDMHHDPSPMKHMAGLVVGITVNDPHHVYHGAGIANLRRLRLYADERPATSTSRLVTSYVLQRDAVAPARDSVERPGQLIVLTQNQPVDVTIVNRLHAATSVHWHGIELESFNDGVAGWSGAANSLAPMIAPSDSFTAHLILPRAGTFIYHTHLNDIEQISSGAYGPIVVLEPGKKFDSQTDHVFTIGWVGDQKNPNFHLAINGFDSIAPPVTFAYGRTHRMRIVNIGAAANFNFILRQDTAVMRWRPIAKDGFDLPESARTLGRAARPVSTGETFDAEWTPPAKGEYILRALNSGGVFATQKIIVK
jgi:FtsP/CotA-like multicopper oxidase with cupredoxin domain